LAPNMAVDKLAPGGLFDQIANQYHALGARHPVYDTDMRR
jgi:hypothetical protein